MADPEKAMEVVNNDDSGEEEEVDGADIKANVAAELLKNPALFSALQGKLNTMVGMNSGYIAVSIFHYFYDFQNDECHCGYFWHLLYDPKWF